MNSQEQWPISIAAREESAPRTPDPEALLGRILRYELLTPVFQPVFGLEDGALFGFEGLIRGPADSPLHMPRDLFATADSTNQRIALEMAAARVILRQFAARRLPGSLLLNLSCKALLAYCGRSERVIDFIGELGLSAESIIIEITEQERVMDVAALALAVTRFRDAGMSIALDDFGDGHSNLRLWMELRPRIVKIDRYFVKGLAASGDKFEIVRLLMRFAESFGTEVVAEGIEDLVDLMAARDLGVTLAQGFLLGRPERDPARRISPEIQSVIASSKVAVPSPGEDPHPRRTLAGDLCLPVPAITDRVTADGLAALFQKNPEWHAVAIVEAGEPVGLINRHTFLDRFARPFTRELYGRQSCRRFSDGEPRVLDRRTPLESMRSTLAGADQRYLRDGLVIADNGRYLGLATGESLVRAVTELRVEAARYANPLTFLPGNIPISQHLDRLLDSGTTFAACYADLNHFKPFNDQYGYWRGDEMILLAARVLQAETDAPEDFLGHIGGDDFFALFQSGDWEARCHRAVAQFNEGARAYFRPEDAALGGFWGEDRSGVRCFFPLTSMSIGAVPVGPGAFAGHEDVAAAAALAKHEAKAAGVALHVAQAPTLGAHASCVTSAEA